MADFRYRLPAGVRPGPVTMPSGPIHRQPAPPAPLALPRVAPRNTARKLVDYLRGRGVSRIYTSANDDVANVSLPQLTVWIRPGTLNWTHRGQLTTWPVYDTAGAARHLAELVQEATPTPLPAERESRDDERAR